MGTARSAHCAGCKRFQPVSSFGRCCVCGGIASAPRRIYYWGPLLRWALRGLVPVAFLGLLWECVLEAWLFGGSTARAAQGSGSPVVGWALLFVVVGTLAALNEAARDRRQRS